MKYISDNPSDFEEDILTMTGMSVEDYVTYMNPHIRFGDQIMVIALCLSLEVSITLYQKCRTFIDVCTFAPRSGNMNKHAELYLDLYGKHYDCVLSAPLADQVSNYSQNLSASLNAESSVEEFAKEKETSEMLCNAAAVSVGDEKLKDFGETLESAENFNPDLSAGSSSHPPAKKVKVDLPHTRVHKGETLLLSDYGLNNYNKLLENNQLDRGVHVNDCKECGEEMDWRIDGPITKGKKSWYFYQPRHNGKCRTDNKKSLAFDRELKEIDSKMIVLNSKKEKSKDDLKQIADLTARRAICFQKGLNSKSQKAAADARARGDCPGQNDHGCPNKSPQIHGKSYCAPCQVKSDAYNSKPESHAMVVRAREKRVEREQHIEMLEPIVVSLQSVDIRFILPPETVEKLRDLSQFVGCDSENKERGNTTAASTHEWVFQDFSTGSTLHLKRYYKNWHISLDSSHKKLISDAEAKQSVFKFVGNKTLMYSAWSQGCDKKRLMDWVGYKDLLCVNYNEKALSFKWCNLGAQACYLIFGPKNPIVTPTMKLLTLFNHLYEVPGTDISVPKPPGFIQCGPLREKCKNDVIQMYDLAQALSLSIQFHDSL